MISDLAPWETYVSLVVLECVSGDFEGVSGHGKGIVWDEPFLVQLCSFDREARSS